MPQNEWTYSSTGIYQLKGVTGKVDTDIAKNKLPNDPKTTFHMTSFAPDCDPVTDMEQVTVMSNLRQFYLRTASGDAGASGSWYAGLSETKNGAPVFSGVFGNGVVVDYIENPPGNPYSGKVSYGGTSQIISPGESSDQGFKGKSPHYHWHVDITGGMDDFERYEHNPQDFCLDV